jgi:acetoacetate decarboxylase
MARAAGVTLSSAEQTYPAAPWELHGQTHGHLFTVPKALLPETPDGFRPLTIAGRGIVVAGWVDYQGGSILQYGEVFCAVAGFVNRRLTGIVTHMWVDSPPSRAGGRELWGYPKELASFELAFNPAGTARAAIDGDDLAHGTFRSRLKLPFRVKLKSGTTQPLHGQLRPVTLTVSGRPALGSGNFTPGPASPLAFLASARRITSFALGDFAATFGKASDNH